MALEHKKFLKNQNGLLRATGPGTGSKVYLDILGLPRSTRNIALKYSFMTNLIKFLLLTLNRKAANVPYPEEEHPVVKHIDWFETDRAYKVRGCKPIHKIGEKYYSANRRIGLKALNGKF